MKANHAAKDGLYPFLRRAISLREGGPCPYVIVGEDDGGACPYVMVRRATYDSRAYPYIMVGKLR